MRRGPGDGIVAAMITRQRIAALIACLSMLAVAAAGAGAGSAKTQRQLDIVKRVTARFKDVSKAEAAGYAAVGECVAGPNGAMGVHYLNAALLGDPRLDLKKPELLLYEPQANGGMRLVGVEWMQLDSGQRAPRLFGRRFNGPMNHNGTAPWHYDLHVWTVRKNKRGTFAQYNRRVSCDAAG
jgi:hypothetical protein